MLEVSEPTKLDRNHTVSFFIRFIATGFFSGYSPVASGTAGSLVACALFLIPAVRVPAVFGLTIVITFFAGTYCSARMERVFGDDPSIVVVDEIVGMWLALAFLPSSAAVMALSFVLFRIFDIFKPPPARRAERLKHGWGVMLDDVIAGAYANISVRLLLIAMPQFA